MKKHLISAGYTPAIEVAKKNATKVYDPELEENCGPLWCYL